MDIKVRFEELFEVEMNDKNVVELMNLPIKVGFGSISQQLHNWQQHQTKPASELENKALTLIFLKSYNYFQKRG